jgi:hypothetical protein
MPWDFVDREQLLQQLTVLIQSAPPEKRLLLFDSPAGMGKTYLLIKACGRLLSQVYEENGQAEWKIVRLDFRDPERQYTDRRTVLEDIARQICRDTQWDSIGGLVQQAASGDRDAQVLIRQAISIPMLDETRQALLSMVGRIEPPELEEIHKLIAQTLADVDLGHLRQTPEFSDPHKQVAVLVDFILREKGRIPNNVLLIFDSLDAIHDDRMRNWITSELALWLHDGLQTSFDRFFVVVCGRSVGQGLSYTVAERYHTDYVLEPFTPEIIKELIGRFGDRRFTNNQPLLSRLARKLSQACGGHPRVIKEVARRLYSRHGNFSALVHDPSRAGYWYTNPLIGIREVLVGLRLETIENIVGDINPLQQLTLELLSVFRGFNTVTLEILRTKIESCQEPPQGLHRYRTCMEDSIDDAFNSLRETHLIWLGIIEPFFSGRSILSLMAAQMQEQDPELFFLLNGWAVEIFEDWVKGKFADDPNDLQPIRGSYQRICVCEWLFHRLRLLAMRCLPRKEPDSTDQVLQDLKSVLDYVLPFPNESDNDERRKCIREYIQKDKEIDHLFWEIAVEDPGQYKAIRDEILNTTYPKNQEEVL